MKTINVPLSEDAFVTKFPVTPPAQLGWMGKLVRPLAEVGTRGVIHQTILKTIAIIVSIFLCISVVFSPLFIYGFKEYIKQTERARFDTLIQERTDQAIDHAQQAFLRGRLAPLDKIQFPLSKITRNQMLKDLKKDPKSEEAKQILDEDLLRMIAVKDHNFLGRYGLSIREPFYRRLFSFS